MLKKKVLEEFYKNYQLSFPKEEVVIGDGEINSKILLIGEAPGREEVKHKKPFVGSAGKNLTNFIEILDIDRKDLYITNTIKYRLGKISTKTGRIINRPANKKDVEKNKAFLLDEISILQPELIVTLGNISLGAILEDKNSKIGSLHGSLISLIIKGGEYKLFPLYHPASIIYNRSLKEVYYQDLISLKKHIKELG